MDNRFRIVIVMLLLGIVPLVACGRSAKNPSSDMLQITVSILPQKYFVERIGGEYVNVNVMVEPGASPATYEPKPEQLKALSHADAYVRIGAPFENAWMNRIAAANRKMIVVDTMRNIERIPMATHYQKEEKEVHTTRRASAAGEPENPDPHIWLSPRLVKVQAQTIYEAFLKLDSKHKAAYQANLERFLKDIDALDADIRKTLAGVDNRKFMVFHPAWGYFARDYELEMIPIEVGGQEPSAAELAKLIAEAKEEGIKVIFAQPEFSTRNANTIAKEIGGEVLLISPLSPDWLDNLRKVAKTFAEVLNHRLGFKPQ